MISLHCLHRQALLHRRQAGISLLEVLVAILILSLGLLGLGSLQATGLRMNHSAYLRSLAAQSAQDMADRMRANKKAACEGEYDTDDPPDTATLPGRDVSEWLTSELAILPAGAGSIVTEVPADANCDNPQTPVTAVIIVEWDDQRAGIKGESPDDTPDNDATNARLMFSTQL